MRGCPIAVAAALLLAGCAVRAPGSPGPRFAPDTRAILAAGTGHQECPSGRADSTRAWTPDSTLVARIDDRLSRELAASLGREEGGESRTDDYYRQFSGVHCGGAPMIRVDGAHRGLLERFAAHRRVRGMVPDTLAWRTTPFYRISHSGTHAFWAWFNAAGQPVGDIRFDCCRPRP